MTGSQLGLRRAERLVQRRRQQRAGVGSRPVRRRGGGRTEGSGRLSSPWRCRPRSWHTAPTWELELCRAAWRRAPWIGTVARQGAEPEPWGRGTVHAARPRRPVGARVIGVLGVHVIGVCVIGVRVFGTHVVGMCVVSMCVFGVHVIGVHVTGVRVVGVCVIGVCVVGTRVVTVRVIGVCVVSTRVVGVHVIGVHVTGVRVVSVRVIATPADPRAAGVLVGRLFFVPVGSGSEGGQEPWALSGTGEDEVLCRRPCSPGAASGSVGRAAGRGRWRRRPRPRPRHFKACASVRGVCALRSVRSKIKRSGTRLQTRVGDTPSLLIAWRLRVEHQARRRVG